VYIICCRFAGRCWSQCGNFMIQCFTADILLPELCLFGFSRRLYGEYAITLCLAEHLTRLTQLGIF